MWDCQVVATTRSAVSDKNPLSAHGCVLFRQIVEARSGGKFSVATEHFLISTSRVYAGRTAQRSEKKAKKSLRQA
jgi:hypothetical protein